MVAEVYARLYPEHTAGVVLVDATVHAFAGKADDPRREGRGGRTFNDADDGDHDGDPADHPKPFPPVPTVVLTSSVGRWLSLPEKYRAGYHPLSLEDVDALWQAGQAETAARVAAPQVIAHAAGHAIHGDAPELVAYAVRAVATAASTGQPVSLSAEQLHAAGGRLATAS